MKEKLEQKKTVGLKIREARQVLNRNEEWLGVMVGLRGGTIRRIETGLTSPKLCDLEKIAEALEVPIGELVK